MTAYCYIKTPLGDLLAIQGENGLEQLIFPGNSTKLEQNWLSVKGAGDFPAQKTASMVEDPDYLKQTSDQIRAYFNRELTTFSIPLAPNGTLFQQSVWHTLTTIPFGITVSYKDVAERIGNHKACRAVGGAVGKNPIPIIIPCHRVIGSDGSLTGFSSGLDIKRYLLNLECVGL